MVTCFFIVWNFIISGSGSRDPKESGSNPDPEHWQTAGLQLPPLLHLLYTRYLYTTNISVRIRSLLFPLHLHLFKDTTSNLFNDSRRTGEILQFDGQQLPYTEISKTCLSTLVSNPPQLTSWCEPRYLFCSAITEIIRESATPSTQTITSNRVVAGPGHASKSSILNLLKGLGHEIKLKYFDKKV